MTEDVHALVAAYALNALDAQERADFEAHLAACEACRDDVAELADVAAQLGTGVAAEPTPALRQRVLDAVSRTPQDGTSDQSTVPVELDSRRRQPRRIARVALIAASALVLATVGVATANSWQERSEYAAMEREAMMVASAPDAHSMDLDLGASHVVVSDRMSAVVAMGQGAPAPEDGMEYQLWLLMSDGSAMPGPTFMPARNGEFMTMVHTELADVAGFAVTQEPMGGSEQPTSTPIATVGL
jgi:anti-sigma-K factor RskA